jgi:hypothetical protein
MNDQVFEIFFVGEWTKKTGAHIVRNCFNHFLEEGNLKMKKTALFLSALAVATSASLFAASNSTAQKGSGKASLGQMQDQTMNQNPDCSQMTSDEQNFANQMMDMNNKSMFCTQFTPQQRQQAMQMMGQPDASGNLMNADRAVQQVMQNSGMTPSTRARSSSGGCPVK